MPGSLSIPGAIPYAGNYQSFSSSLLLAPAEGPLTVPISVQWSTDTPANAVFFDLRSQRNLQISKISALYVDNLSSASDVEIVFPDTQFRLDIPAYTVGVFPVITNSIQFYMSATAAQDGDTVFVQILNFNPPPVAIEKSSFSNGASNLNIGLAGLPSNTPLFTGSGVLRGLDITLRVATASTNDALNISITDGNGGPVLYASSVEIPSAGVNNVKVTSITGLDVIFINGLDVHLVDAGSAITSGVVAALVYYTPNTN